MAYDGNGQFLPLPAPMYPALPGTVIYAEYFNLHIQNILDGLSAALPRDGQAAMTGALRMAGFALKELAAGMAAGDAVEWQQWRDSFYAPVFVQPTTGTPSDTADNALIPNTAWVRKLLAIAEMNFPPILGQSGQLNTDGTTVFWRPGVPDFILNAAGVF